MIVFLVKVDNNYFKSPKEGKTILPEVELTKKSRMASSLQHQCWKQEILV